MSESAGDAGVCNWIAHNELLRVSKTNKTVCLFHSPCTFQLELYSIEERKLLLLYF